MNAKLQIVSNERRCDLFSCFIEYSNSFWLISLLLSGTSTAETLTKNWKQLMDQFGICRVVLWPKLGILLILLNTSLRTVQTAIQIRNSNLQTHFLFKGVLFAFKFGLLLIATVLKATHQTKLS